MQLEDQGLFCTSDQPVKLGVHETQLHIAYFLMSGLSSLFQNI